MRFEESTLYNIYSKLNGKRYSLYDLALWKNGLAFKKNHFSDAGVPVIKIAELNNGISGNTSYTKHIFSDNVHLKKEDLLFSWSGNPQTSIDIFKFQLQEGWLNQHIFKVTPNEEIVDRDYFYFLMKYLKPWFTQIASNKQTTGLGHVTIADIKRMSVLVPSLTMQKKIVDVLRPIDDKIQINTSINNNLFHQAQALYKNRFIDMEPFSGKMPDDWRLGIFSEIIEFHDTKRVPLSNHERANLKKIFPYYGATSIMDYVDKYIFDGVYLLISEDGTVADSKGFPILQYVAGRFWVNNHAHIVTGKNGFTVEILYLLCSLTNIKSIITGAVQQKISQSSLKKVPVIIPSKLELNEFDSIIQPIFAQIRNLRAENNRLNKILNILLPHLLSGKLDVSKIKI